MGEEMHGEGMIRVRFKNEFKVAAPVASGEQGEGGR